MSHANLIKAAQEGTKMSDSDVLDFEKAARNLPWPKKGDKLFMTADDGWHNACLNFLYDQWGLYADGYKRAADVLVGHVKDTKSNQDLLVYPIVFLYRQYIELRLKKLIMDGNQLLDISAELPAHHKIDKLWKQCRSVLEKVWPEGPIEDLEAVEECINQFSAKDASSTAFRYPADKAGNPSIPELRHINLRNLSEVMARLSSLLDSANIGISEYLSVKREIESEYRDSSY